MSKTTLHELGVKYKADKAADSHEYTKVYPMYLEKFRDKPLTFIELGTYYGASCKMWDEYFTHPEARLVGYDHLESRLGEYMPQNDRWNMILGDQWDYEDVQKIASTRGPWDVVIDDCAHAASPQQFSFEAFWPHLNSGGVYIIEDINFSSYNDAWYEFRVCKGSRTIMPFLRELEDELIVADSVGRKYWTTGEHTTEVAFIHYYKHVAVIGKK